MPTSLLTARKVSSAVSSGAVIGAGTMRPSASSSSHSACAPSARSSHSIVSVVAWCSPPGTRMRGRDACALRAQYSPFTARLIDSVPPEVKTTSIGSQPSVAATASRASSSIRLACWP